MSEKNIEILLYKFCNSRMLVINQINKEFIRNLPKIGIHDDYGSVIYICKNGCKIINRNQTYAQDKIISINNGHNTRNELFFMKNNLLEWTSRKYYIEALKEFEQWINEKEN